MLADLVVIFIIGGLLVASISYMVRRKKRGEGCCGCGCGGCSGCAGCGDEKSDSSGQV
ncbi:MAG: FeoB-associated Cys-rich membrane protein [Lachnospiraceae bacterium]|nr:FeoB-associated Cys-rich membrane protein [Lachnospiraceae bacterium]